MLGAGVQAVHFSRGYEARDEFEASYEVFYRVQVRPWLAVKPDVQYIARSGWARRAGWCGGDGAGGDAFLVGGRITGLARYCGWGCGDRASAFWRRFRIHHCAAGITSATYAADAYDDSFACD